MKRRTFTSITAFIAAHHCFAARTSLSVSGAPSALPWPTREAADPIYSVNATAYTRVYPKYTPVAT